MRYHYTNGLSRPVNLRIVGVILAVLGLFVSMSFALITSNQSSAASANEVENLDTTETFTSIQAAIDDTETLDGHTLEIGNGTFTEAIQVNKELTIIGSGEGVTIIDASAVDAYSIEVSVNNVSLSNFTLLGNPSGTAAYGVKVAYQPVGTNLTNFTINDVTVDGSYRTGIDLNGVVGATISDVFVRNVIYGNGISLTDSSNVTISNPRTRDNAWGGIALYTLGRYFPLGSDNIVITGVNANEANPLYVQRGNYGDSTSPEPVTNLAAPQFRFVVENEGAENYTFFQRSRNNALAFAAGLPSLDPLDSTVQRLSDGSFFVNDSLSIETAMNNTAANQRIFVLAGTYPDVVLDGVYPNNIAIIGGLGGVSEIDSIDLTGSTFDGLSIRNFAFTGEIDPTGFDSESAIAIRGDGSYAGLDIRNNSFDGQDMNRRGIFINRAVNGLRFVGNDFMNYVDTTSGTLYSVVFVEAQPGHYTGGPMGNNYVANNNTLANSNLPNFFEAYRFNNVQMIGNEVNAERGRLMVWAQPADTVGNVTIRNNDINVNGGTGIGVYYQTDGTTRVQNNQIDGANNCFVGYDLFNLRFVDNSLSNCATRGVYLVTAGYQELTQWRVSDNALSDSPVGFENNNQLFIETCTNTFDAVDDRFVNNIGCDDAFVMASKIVCEDESLLPNIGGQRGTYIDQDFATNWVNENEGCSFAEGWSFQWSFNGNYPGGDFIGEAGDEWTTFGPTDENGQVMATVDVSNQPSRIEIREVLQDGYLTFSDGSAESAELYCHRDAFNFDNWDWINGIEESETYYCVAFNVELEVPLGQIRGLVYEDVNGNGSQNGNNEEPLEGWTVWLLTQNSPYTLQQTTTTDENGEFVFSDLEMGAYYVCQDLQTGWEQTEREAGTSGLDLSGAVIGNELELSDELVEEYCYIVELDEENMESTENVFGNTQVEEDGFVEGITTDNDNQSDQVLGETTDTNNTQGQVLGETGDGIIAGAFLGLTMTFIALALIFKSRALPIDS